MVESVYDCSKSKSKLKWKPIWRLETALDKTVHWYKAWKNKRDMQQYSLDQIEAYHHELEEQ